MPEERVEIAWDRPMLERFKVALNNAKAEDQTQFVFDEHVFLVAYARYLAEYLEENLP